MSKKEWLQEALAVVLGMGAIFAAAAKPAIYDWVDFIWEHIEPFVLEQREKIDAQKGKYSRFYKKCVDNAVCFRYNNKADLRDSTMARWSSG